MVEAGLEVGWEGVGVRAVSHPHLEPASALPGRAISAANEPLVMTIQEDGSAVYAIDEGMVRKE